MMSEAQPDKKAATETGSHDAEPVDEGEILEWSCHPVRRRPAVSVAVTVFIFIVTISIYYATMSKWFAILAAVILLASLAKFYFPTAYRLSDRRIVVKTTTQTLSKEWSLYRSFYPDKNGVLLSPFVGPSRLENFRGLYLMFNNNRDEIIAFVRERIKREHQKREAARAEAAGQAQAQGEK
jgi:hypothetical protein